jgi:hypothetical protein
MSLGKRLGKPPREEVAGAIGIGAIKYADLSAVAGHLPHKLCTYLYPARL